MAQSSADRQRAYRERKRDGIAHHVCACGHRHYPQSSAPTAITLDSVIAEMRALARQHDERLTAMVNRLTAMQANGRAWQARAIAAEDALAAIPDTTTTEPYYD